MLPRIKLCFGHMGIVIMCIIGFGCKDQSAKPKSQELIISFKTEGTLQLYKAETDSVIVNLDIEIADTEYETQTGLMYRNSLDRNQGMLFIFPDTDYRSFYMKNTKIPLDIIYIGEDQRIVSIQKDAKPFNEVSLPSEKPAKYVLEVNAGLSEMWQLKAGDRIEYTKF